VLDDGHLGQAAITPAQERHLRTVAELQTRLTLSFIVSPHTSINLASIDETRANVRDYLMPMIEGRATAQEPDTAAPAS
jgi:hypothetical protein